MSTPSLVTDPVESAQAAGLRYVMDSAPGIRRLSGGRGRFRYVTPAGGPVRDPATLARIRALAIPPAWTAVWICPVEDGHIQAIGRDARGRKQYRYHARWREVRDETKYNRMLTFGAALARIRDQVQRDLSLHGLPQRKVLAAVLRLLDATLIRVGNEEYAQQNQHYGLTTLRNRHVEVTGARIEFHFMGKSGKERRVRMTDRRLAALVKRCQDLPGQHLFQYLAEDGEARAVGSTEVNEYLRELAGEDYSAKDFRTWHGTVLCAVTLHGCPPCESEAESKRAVVEAIKAVAARLGNTPAVCRRCYVHPAVLDAFAEGSLAKVLGKETVAEAAPPPTGLRPEEQALLRLLRRRLG